MHTGETHSCSEGKRRGRWAFKKKLQKKAKVVGLVAGLGDEAGESQDKGASGQWAIVDGKLKVLARALRITRGGSKHTSYQEEEDSEDDEMMVELMKKYGVSAPK